MKFSIIVRIGVVLSNQVKMQRCYVLAMKEKRTNSQETNVINSSLEALEIIQCFEH